MVTLNELPILLSKTKVIKSTGNKKVQESTVQSLSGTLNNLLDSFHLICLRDTHSSLLCQTFANMVRGVQGLGSEIKTGRLTASECPSHAQMALF